MAQTIAGIVEKPVDAQRLIDELVRDCLCDRADISVIARSTTEKASARADEPKGALDTSADGMHMVFDGFVAGIVAAVHSSPGRGTGRGIRKLGATVAHV